MRLSASDRFWAKVDCSGSCWLWTASVTWNGYGRFAFGGGGKWALAHRFSYELEHGRIPAGLVIDHLCCNKRCVRPSHLEAVTFTENIRRRPLAGVAATNAAKTHCPMGHLLSGDNLRGGQRPNNRACKQCCTEKARERIHAA